MYENKITYSPVFVHPLYSEVKYIYVTLELIGYPHKGMTLFSNDEGYLIYLINLYITMINSGIDVYNFDPKLLIN